MRVTIARSIISSRATLAALRASPDCAVVARTRGVVDREAGWLQKYRITIAVRDRPPIFFARGCNAKFSIHALQPRAMIAKTSSSVVETTRYLCSDPASRSTRTSVRSKSDRASMPSARRSDGSFLVPRRHGLWCPGAVKRCDDVSLRDGSEPGGSRGRAQHNGRELRATLRRAGAHFLAFVDLPRARVLP